MRGAPLLVICACTNARISALDQASIACESGPTVHGMDVSSYDTVTDWAAARSSGIDFAFVRVSDGTQYPDPDFAKNWAGAHSAGVLRGAYQFFRPGEDPIAQADLLLANATGADLPPVLDLENAGGLTTEQVTTAARAWVDHAAAAIGRPPIVYAGLYSWPTLTDSADFTTSPLWIAQYTSAACPDIPRPWTRWTFWQDSSTGSATGVANPGSLDLDIFSGTLDDLHAFVAAPPAACATVDATTGLTIAKGDPCFVAGGPPAYLRDAGTLVWTHATSAATESNFAQWNLDFAAAGAYRVEAYTNHAYAQSKQAAYEIYGNSTTTIATIDQSAADGWQTLGTFDFAAGGDQWVHLSDNTGETTSPQLVFDSLRITPIDPPVPPEMPPPATREGGGCAAGSEGSIWLVLAIVGLLRRVKASKRTSAG